MKNKKKFYIIVPVIAAFLCVTVIAAAVILGVPDKVSAAQVGKQIDLGNKYLAAAEYDKAEVTFAKALKISPKSVKAATGMAKVYNKKKQPEKAVEYLKKASENLTDGEDAKELQKAVADTKEQIVAQEETGNQEQNAGNNTKNSTVDNSGSSENVDLAKIEEIVNGALARLMPVAVVKNDTSEDDDTDGAEKNKEDLNSGSALNGTASKNKTKKATPKPTITPTITPEPTESPVVIIDQEDDSDDPDVTVTQEPDKDSKAAVTPEITETPEDTDEAGSREIDGIPVAREDEESTSDYEEYGEVEVYPEISPIGGDGEWEREMMEEGNEDPETEDTSIIDTENTDIKDVTVSDPESVLEDYADHILSAEMPSVSWNDTQIPFTYGESSASALTGRLAETMEDLDGDGTKELLVVEAKNGDMVFHIYKTENGTVELKTSQTVTTGMATPLYDIPYGNTQECFLINNSGKWEIGFATYCYGFDSGDGTPAALTEIEVYSVESDASVKLCASGSVENGQGQENLDSDLNAAGLTGSWNDSNAESLQSIGYAENPMQNLSTAPDPIGEGISAKETECTDLAVMTVRMAAGSGTLTVKSK